MNFCKKGIESYVIIVIIISLIISGLIVTIFNPLFANDHQKCQNIEYNIESKKKIDNYGYTINIKNTGNSKVNFAYNSKEDLKNTLMPNEEKEFTINTENGNFDIIPLYIDINKKVYYCRGKKIEINTKTIT